MTEQDRGERLRASFADAERTRTWPNLRPRDAATLIVVDRRESTPKVLMGRRHHGHKFMPGKFVFPGGRLERSDGYIRSASELTPDVAERLAARCVRRSELRGRALALTAIRETYEETGLLIGKPAPEGHVAQPGHPAWRPFLDSGIVPDLGPVSFIGRAITPPRRPKRFDTRFFCVDRTAVCAEHDGFVGPDKELIELAWVDLKAAQALDLPRITSIMLEELGHRLAGDAAAGGPVPFYRESRGRFLRETLEPKGRQP